MGIKCPKCYSDNPDTQQFCGECGTQILPKEEIPISSTKTLEAPTKELTTGSTFAGRYQIIEELGKGGMGEVYRVKDETLDEEMALKVLKPEIAADKDIIERFKNELKFARKIAHRNVCKMYDLNEEEETPYITMEYVKGEDLKSFIRRKDRLKEEEVIALAKQVCEGLAEAHELGVVHRDLKPQNIMIDEKSNAKIMDFGIARSVEAPGVTQSGVMIGTPDYMSPEQAEGEEADQRSDIYALGVILYEMVTGSVPFKGDTAFSVALKHKTKLPSDPRKLNPEVSDDLSRLILICMEKDRERRYQTAVKLLSDLRNIEEGFPLGTKIQLRRKTFATALIQKKLFIPALVVALAIIAVVIWQLIPEKEAGPSAPSGKPSLAILYFENNTGDENLNHWRKMLSDLLITDLTQSKHFRILSGDKLFKILSQLNQLEAKTFSSDVLNEVANQGNVNHLLMGKYARMGDIFRIDVIIQEADTGEIISSLKVEARGEKEIFPRVDELTKRIKTIFRLSAEEIASDIDKEVEKITTSSPEAYKYYIEGNKYDVTGDFRKAILFYEKAVAIDPEFATAYLGMAIAYYKLGFFSEETKYLQKAFALSDRVSDRERYLIEAEYYSRTEKTYDKSIEAFKKLLEIYPDDSSGNNDLGWLYNQIEEWDKAIKRLDVNIQNKITDPASYFVISSSYRAKGLYDKTKDILEYYLNNFSDNTFIHFSLASNYFCQGKLDLALVEVDKAFSGTPALDFYVISLKGDIYSCRGDLVEAEKEYQKLLDSEEQSAHLYGKNRLAAIYLLQGRFEKSKIQTNQGIELAKKLGEKSWESSFHICSAYRHIRSGNPEEALKDVEKARTSAVEAESLSGQRVASYTKGFTYLEMKSMDEAQRTADELKELIEKGMNRKAIRYYHHLMGMIELKRENPSKAIENFKEALSLLPSQCLLFPYITGEDHALFIEPLALAHYKAGDIDRAREEYERIVTLTSGRINYGDIYAKSFYMLGKIYEQKGWKGKAIEHYDKFLDLWKDADPGIAGIEDAKKRLGGLKE